MSGKVHAALGKEGRLLWDKERGLHLPGWQVSAEYGSLCLHQLHKF